MSDLPAPRAERLEPPCAKRVPLTHERFGLSWHDDWAWLRDPGYPAVKDPEILAYLTAENDYIDAVMAPQAALIEQLHAELKARLKEDDSSVPVVEGAFAYHWSYAPGAQYRTWWRQTNGGSEPAPVLDENQLAAGKPFFNLRAFRPSPDGTLLALTIDEDGSERYRLAVRDMVSGEERERAVANMSGTVLWAEDGQSLFYVELNESLRPFRVRAHRLGDAAADDRVVFTETDPAFFVSLRKTRDHRYLVIASGTHVTSELHVLQADGVSFDTRLIAARRTGHRYDVDHAGHDFWIVTNDRHENFRLVRAPDDQPGEDHWVEVIAGSADCYILNVACFADFLVLCQRIGGLTDLRVRRYDGAEHSITFPESVCTASLGDNRVFATERLRLSYTSMVTPATVYDYELSSRTLVTRKVQEIPSGYDRERYRTARLMAEADDGTMIPVTVVHRDDYPTDGTGRLFLYGYGAYGMGLDPAFSPHRLTILDRGFAFAFAHVRGGDELGWHWYEAGKLAHKERSFTDFIAVAEYLVAEGLGQAGRIAIRGGSAGGLLMGAVTNARPDLWNCVVAEVPFVDVVNTMSDPTLPLTPIEWPEWGNPLAEPASLERLLAYSPYDNIQPKPYPAILATAGLSDPRVTYWEPAKYVARLRATKTDANLLLLKTNMDGGHFGRSGRYDQLHELALQYAFVLRCFGLA